MPEAPAYRASGDPLLDLRNRTWGEKDRSEAAVVAWGEVSVAAARPRAHAGVLKDLAWSQQTPVRLRLDVLDLLTSDDTPEGEVADSKRWCR
ncbi:MAG: hypothetical protein R3B49_08210 [Phycisphaerales bacterium]